jgi:hypothetical protein
MATVTAHDVFEALVGNIEWFEQREERSEFIVTWLRQAVTPQTTTLRRIYAKLAKHTNQSDAWRTAQIVQLALPLLGERPVDVWAEVQEIALTLSSADTVELPPSKRQRLAEFMQN